MLPFLKLHKLWGTCGENKKQKNRKRFIFKGLRFHFVRMKGLEPPRLSAPDPKSGAAANYATSALLFTKSLTQLARLGFLLHRKKCHIRIIIY